MAEDIEMEGIEAYYNVLFHQFNVMSEENY